MKKFWGLTLTIVICAAVIAGLAPTFSRAPVQAVTLPLTFPNSGFTPGGNNGIFIIRDAEKVDSATPLDMFTGSIEATAIKLYFHAFKFEAVKEIDGKWYTSREYSAYMGEPTSGVAEWFRIDGEDEYTTSDYCLWELGVKNAAGKYGVRARGVELRSEVIDGVLTETYVDKFDENGVYSTNGEYWDFFFTIFYGEELRYLNAYGAENKSSVHLVQSAGREVKIKIATNNGAFQWGRAQGNTKTDSSDDFVAGTIEGLVDIYWAEKTDMNLAIELNGREINMDYRIENGVICMTLPTNLQQGRYLVSISHSYNKNIVATYVIDNGEASSGGGSAHAAGVAFTVIGVIILLAGTALFLSPRMLYGIQQKRYQRIEDKVYGQDAKSIRQRQKEAKAGKSQKEQTMEQNQTKIKSFISQMEDSRSQRDRAHEAGMSIDEYKAFEKERALKTQTAETLNQGLGDLRRDGEEIKITDTVPTEDITQPKPKHITGDPEFDLLDSVREQGVFANEQFVGTAVQPHVKTTVGVDEYTNVLEDSARNPNAKAPDSDDSKPLEDLWTPTEEEIAPPQGILSRIRESDDTPELPTAEPEPSPFIPADESETAPPNPAEDPETPPQ